MAIILLLKSIPDETLNLLKNHYVIHPGKGNSFSRQELFSYLPEVKGIMALGSVDSKMIDAAPNLEIISNFGAGYDQIDIEYASQKGILVTNTPSPTTIPTAEIAISLLLNLARKTCDLNKKIRENHRELFGFSKYIGISLEGKTLGIIGMGRIGGIVAQFGKLMNMKVIYSNRNVLDKGKDFGAEYKPLDHLLEASDFVSIHVPKTKETINLLDSNRLSKMKKTSYIINTARGAILDYDHLTYMLQNDLIAGAGLDVFPNEPNISKELLALKNVILTPHVGTSTHEVSLKMFKMACQSIIDYFQGIKPENIVNEEAYLEAK